jgi:putative ABC transport system ATP-binding protein
MSKIVELEGIVKTYHRGIEVINAIDGIDLAIETGDYLSVVGPSGSGKTTLLNILGCIDRPTEGVIRVHGTEVEDLSDNALAAVRSTTVGFVFQHFFLMPTLTAVENVMLPGRFAHKKITDLRGKAMDLLETVGMTARADHLPGELSGGEMQRVALARSLVNEPALLLADEPTGNLDSVNAAEIMELFKRLNDKGLAIVVVTHNVELAQQSASSIHIQDGKIVAREGVRPEAPSRSTEESIGDAPDYVTGGRKRRRGSLASAAATAGIAVAMLLSVFMSWTVGFTGLRLFTLYSYGTSLYGGNFLVRTYSGKPSVLFTGFWPILGAALLLAAAIGIAYALRWGGWMVLATGSAMLALALTNVAVIYGSLQPGDIAGAPVVHPGAGLWTYMAASACAVAVGLILLLRGSEREVEAGSLRSLDADKMALVDLNGADT